MMKILCCTPLLLLLLCCKTQHEKEEISPRTVIVSGHVSGASRDMPVVYLNVNKIGFSPEFLESALDSSGNFTFKFSLYIPCDVTVAYQNRFSLIVHPGDSIQLEVNGQSSDPLAMLKSISVDGTSKIINQQAIGFQQRYLEIFSNTAARDSAFIAYDPIHFLRFADSVRKVRHEMAASYSKGHNASDELTAWAEGIVDGDYYSDLDHYPLVHRMALVLRPSEITMPPEYYSYFTRAAIPKASLISASMISNFSNQYIYRYIHTLSDKKIAEMQHHAPVREDAADSVLLQSITTNTADPLLKQICVTQFAGDMLNRPGNLAGFDKHRKLIEDIVREPFLRVPLLKKYDETRAAQKEPAEKDIVAVPKPDGYSTSRIAAIIKDRNKGKVVFVDVWATWCVGCMEEFPYTKRLQKEFGNDVVFAFLCIQSEKKAYDKAIARLNLNGQQYYLTETETQEFKSQTALEALPMYMLINKQGQLEADYGLKPSEDETLTKIKAAVADGI